MCLLCARLAENSHRWLTLVRGSSGKAEFSIIIRKSPLPAGKRRGLRLYHPLIFQIVLPELAP
jgi:hypothetical protein